MTKKILIADDERSLRTVLENALESEGYEVFGAANGEECLSILRDQTIDVLLLDISMPVVDGIAVLKQIKEDTKISKPFVVVITNNDDMTQLADVFEYGVVKYFVKSNMSIAGIVKTVEEHFLSIEETTQ